MIVISVDGGRVEDIEIQDIEGRENEALVIDYDIQYADGPGLVTVPLLDRSGKVKANHLAHVSIWTLEPGAMDSKSLCDIDVNDVIARLEKNLTAAKNGMTDRLLPE